MFETFLLLWGEPGTLVINLYTEYYRTTAAVQLDVFLNAAAPSQIHPSLFRRWVMSRRFNVGAEELVTVEERR